MTPAALTDPRYVQTEVLGITGLKPATLQTWINRSVVKLADQNPGYGRRRQYAAIDIVRLAVMRRVADLRIDLAVGVELADECAKRLLAGQDIPWDFLLTIRPKAEVGPSPFVVVSSNHSAFAPYGPTQGDAWHMRVSDFTEPFEGVVSRRIRPSIDDQRSGNDARPIDPARRETLAANGIHAEPAILFPIGEIVNGTLAQIRALDEQEPR